MRAWRIKADAVSIVAAAANASDESLGLAVLLRGHAVEGTVWLPLNLCEWVGNDCDFSFLILGMKKATLIFPDLRGSCLHILSVFFLDAFHSLDHAAVIGKAECNSDFHISISFLSHLNDAPIRLRQRSKKTLCVNFGADVFLQIQPGIGVGGRLGIKST